MPPFAGYLGEAQARDIIAHLRSLAQPAFAPGTAASLVTVPGAPRQPILFSHLIHAGSFGIDVPVLPCRCPALGVRRAAVSGALHGLPQVIGAQDNPEIGKIHGYSQRGEPIPWVRVFKLPEFTHFPTSRTSAPRLACQTCHGPIERMRVVGAQRGRAW